LIEIELQYFYCIMGLFENLSAIFFTAFEQFITAGFFPLLH